VLYDAQKAAADFICEPNAAIEAFGF